MNGTYFIKNNKKIEKFNIQDINLIEAHGDYVKIITLGASYLILSTMKSIMDKLPENDFIRIHNSYIVRVDKIAVIDGNSVTVNKKTYPVSRCNLSKLMNKIIVI